MSFAKTVPERNCLMVPIRKQSYRSQGKQRCVLCSFLNMASVMLPEMSPLEGMERTDKIKNKARIVLETFRQWTKEIKILAFHVKVTSAKEEYKSQVDSRSHSVDSHPLSPASHTKSNVLVSIEAMVADTEVMHGLANTNFWNSPKLTWLPLLLSARSVNSRN